MILFIFTQHVTCPGIEGQWQEYSFKMANILSLYVIEKYLMFPGMTEDGDFFFDGFFSFLIGREGQVSREGGGMGETEEIGDDKVRGRRRKTTR